MLLQDLVVLGGLIQISATDRSVTARATALVHLINPLDQDLGREMITRDMTLVTPVMIHHQIAHIKIICTQQ